MALKTSTRRMISGSFGKLLGSRGASRRNSGMRKRYAKTLKTIRHYYGKSGVKSRMLGEFIRTANSR